MATGTNTPAARATHQGERPPKIIIPTAWVRAPRVSQGAGGSGPETRAICMCVRW